MPSSNDGPAKPAIFDFVRGTRSSPRYGVPQERVAVLDQDGTLWVQPPCIRKRDIVSCGGQDFVRVYAEKIYGVALNRWSALPGRRGYGKDGKSYLTNDPKLLVNDDNAGKPEGIFLMIDRRPYAAFGCSTGDRQMLKYAGAGDGARLTMIVPRDDAQREYAYGPANRLPDTKVGRFTQALYDEAKQKSGTVISMKNDRKRPFGFEEQ